MTTRRRLLAIGVVTIAAAWLAVLHYTTAQVRAFSDSLVYLQLARQPLHLIAPKPMMLPLLYRAVGADLGAIGELQVALALIAWTALGVALVASMRGRWQRIVAGGLGIAFAIAPFRVGFMTVALGESACDSLLALLVAGAIALVLLPRRRVAVAWAMAIVAVAWIFLRDTNAIAVIVAVAAGVAWWRRIARWAIPLVALPAIAAIVSIWSASQPSPSPSTIAQYADWPPELMARRTYPISDAILARLGDDEGARAFFRDRGMPEVDQIAAIERSPATRLTGAEDVRWCCEPTFATARAWIAEHGATDYVAWIARHPLARIGEFVAAWRELLAPTTLTMYMPPHWVRSTIAGLAESWPFALAPHAGL